MRSQPLPNQTHATILAQQQCLPEGQLPPTTATLSLNQAASLRLFPSMAYVAAGSWGELVFKSLGGRRFDFSRPSTVIPDVPRPLCKHAQNREPTAAQQGGERRATSEA
jgi:hypothetical protein